MAVACLLTPPAHAAPADEFAVSSAQVQALGVKLLRLQPTSDPARGTTHPARVVVPPGQEQVLSAPMSGVVDQILVGEQQAVSAGQVLLRLRSPQYGEQQLKLLEAVNRARLSARSLERERQLVAEGIVPERRRLEAEVAAQDDQARVRQAEAALRLAGVDDATIRRIAGGQLQTDGLTLRARHAGVVLQLDARPGQRVQEADALMRLAHLQPLWLDVPLSADRSADPPAVGTVLRGLDREVEAVVTSVASTVNETQTVTLRARVTRSTPVLRPGEMLQVQVPGGGRAAASTAGAHSPAVWSVPLQALAKQDAQTVVFVRTERGFVARPVTVRASAGTSAQITSPDLQAGQQIAVSAVVSLKAAWQGKSGGE